MICYYIKIEMRIMAHISGDNELCRLFRESGDIYKQLAGTIFKKEYESVLSSEREQAKVICLGK